MQGQETGQRKSYIGVDVSKARLDVDLAGRDRAFANTPDGVAALAAAIRDACDRPCVVVEATGRLHRPLWRGLDQAGVEVVVANPARVRDHARSDGRLAKTDRLDAAALSDFGATKSDKLVPAPWPGDDAMELKDLEAARRALVADRARLKTQIQAVELDLVRRQIQDRIRLADAQIHDLDREIDRRIAARPDRARKRDIILSIPGCGPAVARAIVAGVNEIGRIAAPKIAALLGLAPINHDSGERRGKRAIAAGRPGLRAALYMPALAALRCNPQLRSVYDRLVAKGKPRKLAITAVMRKLIILLNTLIRENRMWQPQCP